MCKQRDEQTVLGWAGWDLNITTDYYNDTPDTGAIVEVLFLCVFVDGSTG